MASRDQLSVFAMARHAVKLANEIHSKRHLLPTEVVEKSYAAAEGIIGVLKQMGFDDPRKYRYQDVARMMESLSRMAE